MKLMNVFMVQKMFLSTNNPKIEMFNIFQFHAKK